MLQGQINLPGRDFNKCRKGRIAVNRNYNHVRSLDRVGEAMNIYYTIHQRIWPKRVSLNRPNPSSGPDHRGDRLAKYQ